MFSLNQTKPQQAAAINAFVLIAVGCWGFVANHFMMHTLIVPLTAGVLFFILSSFLKNGNRNLIIFILIVSFILFFAFILPFQRNMEQHDFMGMIRVALEMMATAFAIITYLRNLFLKTKQQIN